MKKLNLGCGADIRLGYINIDVAKNKGVDLVMDITKKLPFENGSCEEVLMQDILEHLIYVDQEKLLGEVSRVLSKKGVVRIRTPNIEAIWEQMADDPEARNLFVYGDTENQGMWGAHKTGHTLASIGTLFRMCDFRIAKYREEGTNWIFELVKEKLEVDSGKNIKIWKILKPVKKNYWLYRLGKYFADEIFVPNQEVYDSLFPKTHLPRTRVKINQLEFQKRRAYARKMAKIDLGI